MDRPAKTAFGAHIAALGHRQEGSLWVSEAAGWGIAAIMARRGQDEVVQRRLAALKAPTPSMRVLHTGPGNWLVFADGAAGSLHSTMVSHLTECAQVFDQSAGYGLLQIEGASARALLQKGIFVDLEIALAKDRDGISSVISQISVSVWRGAADLFYMAVPRSYAGSFWHWLECAAAAENIALSQ